MYTADEHGLLIDRGTPKRLIKLALRWSRTTRIPPGRRSLRRTGRALQRCDFFSFLVFFFSSSFSFFSSYFISAPTFIILARSGAPNLLAARDALPHCRSQWRRVPKPSALLRPLSLRTILRRARANVQFVGTVRLLSLSLGGVARPSDGSRRASPFPPGPARSSVERRPASLIIANYLSLQRNCPLTKDQRQHSVLMSRVSPTDRRELPCAHPTERRSSFSGPRDPRNSTQESLITFSSRERQHDEGLEPTRPVSLHPVGTRRWAASSSWTNVREAR